jgi:hypothetical protein
MSHKRQRQQWQKEVRARHAEDRVKPPVLEEPRTLRVNPDHLAPTPFPAPQKLLKVKTEYFSVLALWRKLGGIWSCVMAPPEIRWMKGMSPDRAKLELLKMGADFHFLDPNVRGPSHGAL